MISIEYVRLFSRYNEWQNRSLYGAASTLDDAARKRDRGAFFGSIHGTLSHLLWGDQTWMSRFAGTPKPRAPDGRTAVDAYSDWAELQRERAAFDQVVIGWADSLAPSWLEADLTWYSGGAKKNLTKPRWILVAHMFNHQTHHRGQVHAMLTAAGTKPDDTDIGFMPWSR